MNRSIQTLRSIFSLMANIKKLWLTGGVFALLIFIAVLGGLNYFEYHRFD